MNKVIQNTTLSLLGTTILAGLLLSSTHVFSDTEVIDEVRLIVPVACTMSGTGTTHTATLNPGTYSGASGNEYENGIGKTTLTAICNDDNGFSIYAIGFTGNEYGVTNLVGENTSGTISTKAYQSGDTTSNWSMKLTKVDNPVSGDPVTYNPGNLTISTGYNTWHAVPADYTKVAEYHASTGSSTTDTTLGVKLETTYAAYIASNQAADTYVGQVKYTMVHPYDAAEPVLPGRIGVTYHANGHTFAGDETTNRVIYAKPWIAVTPLIAKSTNVADDGTKTTAYASDANDLVPITAAGAIKMKVVVNYSVSTGTGLFVISGIWNGEGSSSMKYEAISEGRQNASGTETYIFDGDSITMFMMNPTGDAPTTDYDYGFFAQVYPVYATEQPGTEPSAEFAPLFAEEGTYAQTTLWDKNYYRWYAIINGNYYNFSDEAALVTFLDNNFATLVGTNIDLYCYTLPPR